MIFNKLIQCICYKCNNNFVKLRARGSLTICKKCQNKARVKAWKIANKERKAWLNKDWAAKNIEKDRASKKKWDANNKDHLCAKAVKHRAKKLMATPSWANEFFMKEAYSLARLREKICGGKWHVDHIVPLKSDKVCGLHWEGNMQVIPAKTNQSKSNKFWPDMPNYAEGNV